jgi:hypothetical protein
VSCRTGAATRSKRAAYIIGLSPIGVAIALVLLAVAVLTLVALRSEGKPKKRPEKWEKAEIMK